MRVFSTGGDTQVKQKFYQKIWKRYLKLIIGDWKAKVGIECIYQGVSKNKSKFRESN